MCRVRVDQKSEHLEILECQDEILKSLEVKGKEQLADKMKKMFCIGPI